MPAGGGVAAGRAQALGLTVGEVVMARHGEGGSGANVQVVVLQGVMGVVLTGGGDLDPRAQGQACRSGTVQVVSGLLVLISRENLGAVSTIGRAAGLDAVRGGLLEGESLLRLGAEDFVGCEVGVICRRGRTRHHHKTHSGKVLLQLQTCDRSLHLQEEMLLFLNFIQH